MIKKRNLDLEQEYQRLLKLLRSELIEWPVVLNKIESSFNRGAIEGGVVNLLENTEQGEQLNNEYRQKIEGHQIKLPSPVNQNGMLRETSIISYGDDSLFQQMTDNKLRHTRQKSSPQILDFSEVYTQHRYSDQELEVFMSVDTEFLHRELKRCLEMWIQDMYKYLNNSKQVKARINSIIEPEVILRVHDLQKNSIVEKCLQRFPISRKQEKPVFYPSIKLIDDAKMYSERKN